MSRNRNRNRNGRSAQRAAAGGGGAYHPDDDLLGWELYSIAEDDDFTLDGTTGNIEVWANRGTADVEWRQATDDYQPEVATVGDFKAVDFSAATSKSMLTRNRANNANVNRTVFMGNSTGIALIVGRVTAFANHNSTNQHLHPALFDCSSGGVGMYVSNRTDLSNQKTLACLKWAATPVLLEIAQDDIFVAAIRMQAPSNVDMQGSLNGGAPSTQENVGALAYDALMHLGRNVTSGADGFTGQILLTAFHEAGMSAEDMAAIAGRIASYYGAA
jgi:hypothetical protein